MNSATGIIREDAVDQDVSDPRRGIKLVARKKSAKGFRIRIADELLDTFPGLKRARATAESEALSSETAQAEPAADAANDSSVRRSTGKVSFVLATAAAVGLIVGFLAGRRRD